MPVCGLPRSLFCAVLGVRAGFGATGDHLLPGTGSLHQLPSGLGELVARFDEICRDEGQKMKRVGTFADDVVKSFAMGG